MSPSRFQEVLERTGYIIEGRPVQGLIEAETRMLDRERFDVSRFEPLFSERYPLGASALFRSGSTPLVIFKDATEGPTPTPKDIREWRTVTWNFGLAPILWITTPERVYLYDGYAAPSPDRLDEDALLEIVITGDADEAMQRLTQICGRLAMDNGEFWSSEFARSIDRNRRVDAVLLRELIALERRLIKGGLEAGLAHKLIGRSIFAQYLLQRGLFPADSFHEQFGGHDLRDVLADKSAAYLLFDWIKVEFKGDLFPPDDDFEKWKVEQRHLNIISDFFGDVDSKGQFTLFPLRFDVIPVELISSIYEQFAHSIAGDNARSQGLHYTPVNLVDLLLDAVLARANGHETVLDPACGSGVFLVETLRRLVWRQSQNRQPTSQLVRSILENQIFGTDINIAALQVAAFSLYLACLELDPEASLAGEKLEFRALIGRNLKHASAFDNVWPNQHFDYVVGNPPWTFAPTKPDTQKGGMRTPKEYLAQTGMPSPSRSPDWAFLWRSLDFQPKALGLLMKATPFFSRTEGAAARERLLSEYKNVALVNLSQLRTEGLFSSVPDPKSSGADDSRPNRAPAILVLLGCSPGLAPENVAVATLPWNPHFEKKGVFEFGTDYSKVIRADLASGDPSFLKAACYGYPRDFELLERLHDDSHLVSLATWVENNKLKSDQGWRGGSRQDPRHLVGKLILGADTFDALRIHKPLERFEEGRLVDRRRTARIFQGPLLLLPEGSFTKALEPGRYAAAVDERDLAYTESFVGISFARRDPELAYALCAIMNSTIVAYQLAFGATTIGIKQAKVEKVDLQALRIPDLTRIPRADLDRLIAVERALAGQPTSSAKRRLLEELDEVVLDIYGIAHAKRRLFRDLPMRTWNLMNDARGPRIKSVAPASPELLATYADELATSVNVVVSSLGRRHLQSTGWFRLDPRTMVIRMDLMDGPPEPQPTSKFAPIVSIPRELKALLGGQTYPYLHEKRFVRAYDGTATYVIKPNETRCWSVINALTDADQIIADQASRSSKRRPSLTTLAKTLPA